MPAADTLRARIESSLDQRLNSTLLLRERQTPLTVSTGVPALDTVTGGLPRGALSEIAGPSSSGRTGVMLAALAGATRRQEICALVDASDSFNPASAKTAGIDLSRLLWVRCNEPSSAPRHTEKTANAAFGRPRSLTRAGFAFATTMEQVLKVTDLLLQGGGFGMVVLDMGDIPSESVRRVPLTSWFRFRRAVEPTATVLLLVEQEPWAGTCASLVVQMRHEKVLAHATASIQEQPVVARSWQGPHVSMARQTGFPDAKGWKGSLAEGRQAHILEKNVVSHAAVLRGMNFRAEVVRSWAQRKPPHSAGVCFGLQVAL